MAYLNRKVKVHFIGIGGIGMSGLAEILIHLGHEVSGSDLNSNQTTKKLTNLGAEIFLGHSADNIKDATIIVFSSAIKEDNPEIINAKSKNIPLMKRAEMLAEIMRLKKGIAIAGTHGKTTTTSLLSTILEESSYDPTYLIGGVVSNLKGHAKVGNGEWIVAEVDESDGTFLLFDPIMSVITNIDLDHMDFYHSEENLINSFKKFANRIPFYGVCAINGEDERLCSILSEMKRPYLTFGFSENFDFCASNIIYKHGKAMFDLLLRGKKVACIKLNLPGDHNILNALGAISIAHSLEIGFDQISKSIQKFDGVGRRFQNIYANKEFQIIDDYAHHPTAIAATINAARKIAPEKELIVLFEPHRYSRTKDCWDRFLHCFNNGDKLFLLDVYPASEKPISGITSERLKEDINKLHPSFANTLKSDDDIIGLINQFKEQNTIILTLGAGTISSRMKEIVGLI
jgi:UDP-N-acetylmuramate--alanine ligase